MTLVLLGLGTISNHVTEISTFVAALLSWSAGAIMTFGDNLITEAALHVCLAIVPDV